MAAARCAVAIRATLQHVTQGISEHTPAHAKFKNENASLGSCPVIANCQVMRFGLCCAQGGWCYSGMQFGHLPLAIAAERLRGFISQGLLLQPWI